MRTFYAQNEVFRIQALGWQINIITECQLFRLYNPNWHSECFNVLRFMGKTFELNKKVPHDIRKYQYLNVYISIWYPEYIDIFEVNIPNILIIQFSLVLGRSQHLRVYNSIFIQDIQRFLIRQCNAVLRIFKYFRAHCKVWYLRSTNILKKRI